MSDCNVCIAGYDGDPALVYHEQMVTARKQHECFECHRPIPRGATYERVTGKWMDIPGNGFATYRFCVDCSAIAKGLSCDGSRSFGMLWDEIAEYLFPEMTTGCLQKISEPSAKAYLLERWRKWKGLE